jgi:hypothetical protein
MHAFSETVALMPTAKTIHEAPITPIIRAVSKRLSIIAHLLFLSDSFLLYRVLFALGAGAEKDSFGRKASRLLSPM